MEHGYRDHQLKAGIRRGRILFRSIDLLCNLAIMSTVSAMLVFISVHADATFKYQDASGKLRTARVIPTGVDLRPSYGLLSVACISLIFSIAIMLGYLRSHKTAGRTSTLSLVIELVLSFSIGAGCYIGASTFQIPKSRKLVRNDLWATYCSPIRNPKPGAPLLPPNLAASFNSLCLAGDWSVICGYISGVLQSILVLTLCATLFRMYNKYRQKRRPNSEEIHFGAMGEFQL